MPHPTTAAPTSSLHRAAQAVASFHRLMPRIQPDAALATTLSSWIYDSTPDATVAAVTRALVTAYTAEIERHAVDLQAVAARVRADRAAASVTE